MDGDEPVTAHEYEQLPIRTLEISDRGAVGGVEEDGMCGDIYDSYAYWGGWGMVV